MASLEVREYLMEVEDALEGRMGRAERKRARREVRSLVQDMAFRLAAAKRRPKPADLDYEIALEALKPPEEAADVLAGREEVYSRAKWVGRGRTLAVLVVLGVVGALAWGAMTGTTSEPVFSYTNGTENRTTSSTTVSFPVEEGYERLDVRVRGIVTSDEGLIRVTLLDPSNQAPYQETFTRAEGGLYGQANLPDASAGNWTLVVDFDGVSGSVRVEVSGVSSR